MPISDDDAPRPVRTLDRRDLAADGETEHDVVAVRRRAATFGGRPDDPTVADSVRAFVRRYGWRAYALPVLTIVTILAMLTAGNSAKTLATGSDRHAAPSPAPPVASANIQLKSDTPGANARNNVLSAAALPSGATYTAKGAGTFRVLKGKGPVVGTGTLHRYTIDVENGITGVDLTAYAKLVQATLSDRRSWAGHGGLALQRVESGQADFHVTLTSSMTVRSFCGYDLAIETSCFVARSPASGAAINRVVLNISRWVRGDANYVGDLNAYRVYMINHEDGHALGHQHAHDCLANGLAPVMMQQTLGLRSAVSHALCQANPWPFPKGARDAPGAEAPDTPQNTEIALKND